MKLRAKINDQAYINLFSRIFNSLLKLGKLCVVRFTSDNIFIILSDQNATNSVFTTCQISQGRFFEEYIMEGLDVNEANEIYMEILVDNIVRALKNPTSTKSIRMKLTKRKGPTLTIEAENITTSTGLRNVVHDVPVNLISKKFWSEYHAPNIPSYDISLYMPGLKILRNVLERMKNMGNHVTLNAKPNGELAVNIETDMVDITTHFTDLSRCKDQNNLKNRNGSRVRVDLKKLSAFISSHQAQSGGIIPDDVILNMIHKRLIHLSIVYNEDCVFEFILPGFVENA